MINDTVLILGAKSDIGIALAHEFAKTGNQIFLAGRNIYELENEKKKLEMENSVKVSLYEFDALDLLNHSEFIDKLTVLPSIVISTIGLLGDLNENEINLQKFSNNF